LLAKADLLTAKGMGKIEGSIRPFYDLRLMQANDFLQQIRSEHENCAIVPTPDRMRDTVRLGLIEEQNMVWIGDKLAASDLLQKHARAWENHVMAAGIFFLSAVPAFRATTHVMN